jgi:hypothetical protein
MVAFGYHLSFRDDEAYKRCNSSTDIDVREIPWNDPRFEKMAFGSPWLVMSGADCRYLGEIPFETAEKMTIWGLEVQDTLSLVWDAQRGEICYAKGKNYSRERLYFWVLHTFLPLVLEMEKVYYMMHAGAVELNGRTIAFTAPSLGGKSTLTDQFLRKGHTLFSDDSLAIREEKEGYRAFASYPFYRPYRRTEDLGYRAKHYAEAPRWLGAVYDLQRSPPDASVSIREVKGIEKFKIFHDSAFIDFHAMKKERFDLFARMAQGLPVYQVSVPWDISRLEEVYDAIVAHCS